MMETICWFTKQYSDKQPKTGVLVTTEQPLLFIMYEMVTLFLEQFK